jgi:hypothetical protein
MIILKNVVGVVGYDYIKGLIDERVNYSIWYDIYIVIDV